MGSEVHSLPQTGVDERIGGSHESEVLTERRRLGVKEDDRLVGEGRELGVDAGDNVGDVLLCFVGLRRSQGNLDEDNLASPRREELKESLETEELVLETLDLVQLVSSDDELGVSIALPE